MKPLLLVLFFISCNELLFAQKESMEIIGSLKNQLSKQQDERIQDSICWNVSYHYLPINIDSCLKYGKQALKLAEKMNWNHGKAKAYNAIGNGYNYAGNQILALSYYHKAIIYYVEGNEIKEEIKVKNNIAAIKSKQRKYSDALNIFQEVKKFAIKNNDSILLIAAYPNIGSMFLNLGLSDTIQHHYLDSSIYYYKEAIRINQLFNNQESENKIAEISTGLSELYLKLKKYSEAKKELEFAVKYFEENELYYNYIYSLIRLSQLYYLSPDSVFNLKTDKRLEEALRIAKKALKMAKEDSLQIYSQKECYLVMSNIYESQNNYKYSLESLKEFVILNDKIFNKSLADSSLAKELELKNNIEQIKESINRKIFKEKLEKEQNRKKRQQISIIVLIVIVFVMLLFSIIGYPKKEKTVFYENSVIWLSKILVIILLELLYSYIHHKIKLFANEMPLRYIPVMVLITLYFSFIDKKVIERIKKIL